MTRETSEQAPQPAKQATTHVCPECSGPVAQSGKGKRRVFCSEAHKQAHANRRAVRGKAAIALAQAWRIDRGGGETAREAFRQFVALLDEFNLEDREQGRARADVYARTLIEQGDVRDRRNVSITCTKGYQGCHSKHRAAYACPSINDARRAAIAAGWNVEHGSEACPNCREDIKLERRA